MYYTQVAAKGLCIDWLQHDLCVLHVFVCLSQVRWVPFKQAWVTAADDDMIRLWSSDGIKLSQWSQSGGSVQHLYVDLLNQLLVVAMQVRGGRG
jgi:hypothetical protein